jgi:hypothetical protein
MECDICDEPYDHSIRKLCSLSPCPHTFCLKCRDQLNKNKCPHCNEPIKGKHINIGLLKLIPESSYDKLKTTTLKSCIEINEIMNNLKKSNEEKFKIYETKIKSIKQTISDETNKIINILKQNEKFLKDECDIIFNDIKANLNSNTFEFDNSKVKIEKDELNETELVNLNRKIEEIKQKINNNSKQIENKILNNDLLIDQLKKVIKKYDLLKYF